MQKLVTMTVLATLLACAGEDVRRTEPPAAKGEVAIVSDTMIVSTIEASGTALPIQSATLSTRLMANVVEVKVQEGDEVHRGDLLIRFDLGDLVAKKQQLEAGLADVEAQRDLARVNALRLRALYADSAAPRAQLDGAESGLARAEAGVRGVTAQLRELAETMTHGELRAPFDGVVIKRMVDVGTFVAPGAPVITVDRTGPLRITVTIPSSEASLLATAQQVAAVIEGEPMSATIEGVVRGSGGTQIVNAIVANPEGKFLGGSAATLSIPRGTRRALVVPHAAISREGDLAYVHRRTDQGDMMTLVRTGVMVGDRIEILAGLTAGEKLVLTATGSR